MIIAVASGKGGTGKTTIAVNLAVVLAETHEIRFVDADVDAPNAHLFLKPRFTAHTPATIPVPVINEEQCTYCGKCAQACAFNALAVGQRVVLTFPELCHGCGACSLVCPVDAIEEQRRLLGAIGRGFAGPIQFGRGQLNPGEALTATVTRDLRRATGEQKPLPEITIIDAPPGTACPAVEAVKGSDFCVLVTEPTPFGLRDLELALTMLRLMNIPVGAVINRADLGDGEVVKFCRTQNVPVLARIPFDRKIAESYSRGDILVKTLPDYRKTFENLARSVVAAAQEVVTS